MPIRENPRIFISYARSDGRQVARRVRERLLNEHGFAVWQDLAEMEGGKDWWQQIEAVISQCLTRQRPARIRVEHRDADSRDTRQNI